MRILVVCQHFFPENFSITSICEGFVKKGHFVTVITAQPSYGRSTIFPGYEHPGTEFWKGIEVIRVKTAPRKKGALGLVRNYFSFLLHSIRGVKKIKKDYDVVYSMCLSPITSVFAGLLFSKKHHLKHVHHCLDVWPASAVSSGFVRANGIFYHFLFSISGSIYKKMDRILVSSPSFENYLVQNFNIESKKISFVSQPGFPCIREAEGISYKAKFNLVYAGNIGSVQMVELLVKACSFVDKKFDFCLHLLGDGSHLNDVLSLISILNLGSKVKYEGRVSQEDVFQFCKNSNALVLALKEDDSVVSRTIPYKLITYLSYGRPIVASLSGDAKEMLERAGGSFLCSQDPLSIAKSYEKSFDLSLEESQILGGKNKLFFQQNFDFDVVEDKILSSFF